MPSDEETEKRVNPNVLTPEHRALLAELENVHAVGKVSDLDETEPLTPDEMAALKAVLNQLAENLGGKSRTEAVGKIRAVADLAADVQLKKKDS